MRYLSTKKMSTKKSTHYSTETDTPNKIQHTRETQSDTADATRKRKRALG